MINEINDYSLEQKKYLKDLEEYLAEQFSTKEKACEFLQRCGIYTKKNKLTKNYK